MSIFYDFIIAPPAVGATSWRFYLSY